MKLRILLPLMIFGALCMAAQGVGQKKQAPMQFTVTKVAPKPVDKLVRVSGDLIGQPHTSNRIDRVLLVNGRDTVVANDIDGVDFNRYFQWEDDGVIELEIDFPAKGRNLPKVNSKSRIVFETVLGEHTAVGPRK